MRGIKEIDYHHTSSKKVFDHHGGGCFLVPGEPPYGTPAYWFSPGGVYYYKTPLVNRVNLKA